MAARRSAQRQAKFPVLFFTLCFFEIHAGSEPRRVWRTHGIAAKARALLTREEKFQVMSVRRGPFFLSAILIDHQVFGAGWQDLQSFEELNDRILLVSRQCLEGQTGFFGFAGVRQY